MITLPPDRDAQPKTYLHKAQRLYVDVAEVPRANLMIKNCQEWMQYDEVSGISSLPRKNGNSFEKFLNSVTFFASTIAAIQNAL